MVVEALLELSTSSCGAVVVVVVLRRVVDEVVVAGCVVDVVSIVEEVDVDDEDELDVVDDDEVVELPNLRSCRLTSSSSGDTTGMRFTSTPSSAFFITSEKIAAGNDPPLTARPWTRSIGFGSM